MQNKANGIYGAVAPTETEVLTGKPVITQVHSLSFMEWLQKLETNVGCQVPSWNAANMYNRRMSIDAAAFEFKKLLEIN